MKKTLLLSIITLFCALCLTAKERKNDSNLRNFTVSGKVINRPNPSENRVIEFIFGDPFTGRQQYHALLDDSSCFRLEVPIRNMQDFYMKYGTLMVLLALPGENLEIEINADILKTHNKKGMLRVTGGSCATTNRHYLRFDEQIPNANYIYQHATTAIKEKLPEEYKQYIYDREKVYREFLNKFNEENQTDSVFRLFISNKLKYGSLEDLLRYAWLRPLYLRNPAPEIDDSYYSFLKKYQLENTAQVSSFNYAGFVSGLKEYFLKMTEKEYSGTTLIKEPELFCNHFYSILEKNVPVQLQELLLACFYLQLANDGLYEQFNASYTPSRIRNPYFKKILQEKQKSFSKKPKLISLKKQRNPILKELTDTLFTRYSGKILYIDFWAPWCGPCLQQFPYSQKLQKHYEGKNITFLFLANQCSEESWRNTIREKHPDGEHIRLSEDQYKLLASLLNINGIPHYILVTPDGRIALPDAPRPSQKDQLIPLFDQLLKQYKL